MAEESIAKIRRVLEEAWSKGNLAVIDEVYADSYVLHDPVAPGVRGAEGVKGFVTTYRTSFPDLRSTIEDQVVEGDKVVWRWTARGTHKGEMMGMPPTGKPVTITGITISRFAGGKVVEEWNHWDTLGMMQQLGLVSAPGQPSR